MMAERPQPVAAPEEDEIDLGQLLGQIWHGKLWIGSATLAAGMLGLAWLANTAPTYRADTLLQLEEKASPLALPTALSELAGGEGAQRDGGGDPAFSPCAGGGGGGVSPGLGGEAATGAAGGAGGGLRRAPTAGGGGLDPLRPGRQPDPARPARGATRMGRRADPP